ncbi:GNAT family N-acetyltransferase [Radiobacillus kanasensis]|uniref:GNAT family N-acetyltransferase n=1 Tax=Radiobacillus kanasensis TaxID=2844358 RepID=UPI001E634B64|nr:GNAT family N-acetyltransferase [Radiobacillus kanasensis]UFU00028.1 GNAT family N-acetyltransferase [Radiobacillus kanasensis]
MDLMIRPFQESDFPRIVELIMEEKWTNLVSKQDQYLSALLTSNPTLVATVNETVVGYIRGLTDQHISLYICELLVDQAYRKYGIGKELIEKAHDLYPATRVELLASSTSHTYYEQQKYRPFYGYRKAAEEM